MYLVLEVLVDFECPMGKLCSLVFGKANQPYEWAHYTRLQ